MTLYIVRAKPKTILSGLRKELESGKISKLRPFGETLQQVEEDYCSLPLSMERESVLDRYFTDITVERVKSEEHGWDKIENKPLLWSQ
ncbi:MAG: hypothetical protein M3530_04825 [Thermoproteota archaeon]|nr:hypothetical protein [Thermoproteota archaeon]